MGVDAFVADDRAANLNRGSYQGSSPCIRQRVNREFERFITAPSSVIRATYGASLGNLRDILREFDSVRVYDNSITGEAPKLVLRTRQGQVTFRTAVLPAWLEPAVAAE